MNQPYGSRTPSEPVQPTISQWIGRALEAITSKLKPVDPDADTEVMARIKHVLKPNEKFLQFVARTGLGPASIRCMSRDEIAAFVEQAERNRAEEALPPPQAFEPQQPPKKFLLKTW